MSNKFPVMLASPMKELDRISFPCTGQLKMDGMRALIVVEDNDVTVYSRNGNKLIKLGLHFASVVNHNNMVYDGELTVVEESGKLMDRKAGNGILHKSVESVGTISDEEVKRVRITLWDIIPLKAWKEGIDETPYYLRMGELNSMPDTDLHEIVNTIPLENMEQAQNFFNNMLKMGEEGIILKNDNHPWEAKRSKQIVKMKEVLENDYKIIGFTEGEGKNSGMTGAIQIENADGSIKCSVGTGMDDATRIDIWAKQKTLIGTILTVQHNGIITSKYKNTKSLFLPRYVELRPDKGESD